MAREQRVKWFTFAQAYLTPQRIWKGVSTGPELLALVRKALEPAATEFSGCAIAQGIGGEYKDKFILICFGPGMTFETLPQSPYSLRVRDTPQGSTYALFETTLWVAFEDIPQSLD
jgi:hypothetical protein